MLARQISVRRSNFTTLTDSRVQDFDEYLVLPRLLDRIVMVELNWPALSTDNGCRLSFRNRLSAHRYGTNGRDGWNVS